MAVNGSSVALGVESEEPAFLDRCERGVPEAEPDCEDDMLADVQNL